MRKTFSAMSVAFAPLRLASVMRHGGEFRICRASGCSLRVGEQHVAVGFCRPVFDFVHHVAQIYGPARVNSHHDLLQVLRAGEEVAGLDLEFLIVAGKTAGLRARIGGPELRDNRTRRESICGKALGIEHDAQCPRSARR